MTDSVNHRGVCAWCGNRVDYQREPFVTDALGRDIHLRCYEAKGVPKAPGPSVL